MMRLPAALGTGDWKAMPSPKELGPAATAVVQATATASGVSRELRVNAPGAGERENATFARELVYEHELDAEPVAAPDGGRMSVFRGLRPTSGHRG